MGYGSRAAWNRIEMTIISVTALVVIAIILLCLLYAIIRFYIFGKLLATERSTRAVVTGKRYQVIGAPRDDADNENRDTGMILVGGGCLCSLYWLVSSIPLVAMLRNGLDEPYLVRFDLADGKKVELYVSDNVYLQLNEGQDGLLTYKGRHLVHFKSQSKYTGLPVNITEHI